MKDKKTNGINLWLIAIVLTATLVFASCGGGELHDIKITMELSGFTPYADSVRVTTVPPNDYCTGTIAWEQSTDNGATWATMSGSQFAAGVKYRAILSLSAFGGYTFNGLGDMDIFYADAYVSTKDNTGDTLTVTVTFPTSALPPPPKTVTVGVQVGLLMVGEGGTASFAVTTTSISDSTYQAIVAPLPTGVTVSGDITITGGAGTLTLAGSNETMLAGSYSLTLTIDGKTSAAFSLEVIEATLLVAPAISTDISTTDTVNQGGTIFFTIVATGSPAPTYQWKCSTDSGSTWSDVAGATTATLRLTNVPASANGNQYYCVVSNGVEPDAVSSTVTLTVPPRTVTVNVQNGTIDAGDTGEVTFSVTTTGFSSGFASVSVANLPTGVTVKNSTTFHIASDGTSTLTLQVTDPDQPLAGVYSNLTLTVGGTINGATSEAFTLTIEGATGSFSDPFIVKNMDTLKKVGSGKNGWNMNSCYRQTASISLNSTPWTPIGTEAKPFTGTYEGRGYTINSLTINANVSNQGLFGVLEGTVKDIKLSGVSTTGSGGNYIGGIAGKQESSHVIASCSVAGSISGNNYVGGIVGNSKGSIYWCSVTANVTGSAYVGGISGYASGSGIQWCNYLTGTVKGTSATGCVGGIVGWAEHNLVDYSYVMGCTITGTTKVGGIVGWLTETGSFAATLVESCAAMPDTVTASVSDRGRVIGFKGANANINFCYARSALDTSPGGGSSLTGKDGLDVAVGTSSGQFNNQDWWTNTSGIDFKFGNAYDRPWVWSGSSSGYTASSARPKLWWESKSLPYTSW